MFFKIVSEKAAFDWLRREFGDAELLLASDPLPWERSIFWIGRVNGRKELLQFWRTYLKMNVDGACWFAGHPETLKMGERLGDYSCGRKFISLRDLHPESWSKPALRRSYEVHSGAIAGKSATPEKCA